VAGGILGGLFGSVAEVAIEIVGEFLSIARNGGGRHPAG
jgi:hypothetical protein